MQRGIDDMIEMVVESVRVNLMSPSRVVVLKECDGPRYLAIMIGSGEADAIAVKLQGHETPRPLTHDLLKQVIETVGGSVTHVVVTDLVDTTYFATIVLDIGGSRYKLDARPSDAIALAVRANTSILVEPAVLDDAGFESEPDDDEEQGTVVPEEKLEIFREFINQLDIDDLGAS